MNELIVWQYHNKKWIIMENSAYLLIALLVCHYLADFCLTMPVMIRAKADGKNLWPIALHSAIHAFLMGLCILIYGTEWWLLLVLIIFEFVSHFGLDVSKAKISTIFLPLSNNRHKPYWVLYGLDQLLHQVVVVLMWYFAKSYE